MINSRQPKAGHQSPLPKENQAARFSRRASGANLPPAEVTVGRFGRVDRPTREDTSEILRVSLSRATEGAEQLLDATVRIAGYYRAYELDRAEQSFSTLLSALRKLAHVTAILVVSTGSAESRNHLDAVVNRLLWIFDDIAKHKEARRWTALAERMDVDLVAALDRWTAILKALPGEFNDAA